MWCTLIGLISNQKRHFVYCTHCSIDSSFLSISFFFFLFFLFFILFFNFLLTLIVISSPFIAALILVCIRHLDIRSIVDFFLGKFIYLVLIIIY